MVIYPGHSKEASWYFASDLWCHRLNMPALQNLLPSLPCSGEFSLPTGPFALCLKSPISPGHHSMQTCSVRPISIKEVNWKSSQGARETSQENLGEWQHVGTFPTRQQAEKRPGSCRASPNCYTLRGIIQASQNSYNCFTL